MMALLAKLTGGRPMRRDCLAFVDCVSGRSVCEWTDKIGRRWLAEGPWSLFRVRLSDETEQTGVL